MQETFLEKNPFYILEVTPGEKRASIISKAEEKAFFADGNEYEEAQSSLLNPTRRLSAELEWFFDITAKNQAEIINSIKNKKEICTDELSGISRLNAALYNFSVLAFDDYFKIGYAILEIDALYEKLDSSDMYIIINKYRAQSGITPATESDIISALGKKRAAIRQTISERLETLSEEDHVALVSIIAEKYIAEDTYDDGVVIGDIVDQYEVRIKSVIDEKMDAALSMIAKVNANTDKPIIDLIIHNLISTLKEFDKYARPLQIKSLMNGTDHELSSHLARECRDFAIKLHNDYDNSDAAFKLIHALKEIFTKLMEFSEFIENDEKQITTIKEEKEKFKKDIEANRQANKCYKVHIHSNQFVVPPFCTCCMKPTSNKEYVSYSTQTQNGKTITTHSISVDMPICEECLKHRSQYNWLLGLICTASIVIGSMLMSILMAIEIDVFSSLFMSTGITAGAYFVISTIFKTKPLSREHARRGKSVHIFSMNLNEPVFKNMPNFTKVIFTFYNWEYAHLFYEANKAIASDVREETELNTARSTSVLEANEHPIANMFKTIGGFIVVALMIGIIFMCITTNYDYSDNNYQNNNNYAYSETTYTVTLDKQGGTGGTYSVDAAYGKRLPDATPPTRSGYEFIGYYSQPNGVGTKYYNSDMNSIDIWYGSSNETIYAYWIKNSSNDSAINITKDNFEDYFTLTTDAELVGDNIKITYSIKPKSGSYASNSNSSDTIKVELGAVTSSFSEYYGEPEWDKKYTVILNKNNNYTASGSFSFSYYSFSETIYWLVDVASCSGEIGK